MSKDNLDRPLRNPKFVWGSSLLNEILKAVQSDCDANHSEIRSPDAYSD